MIDNGIILGAKFDKHKRRIRAQHSMNHVAFTHITQSAALGVHHKRNFRRRYTSDTVNMR